MKVGGGGGVKIIACNSAFRCARFNEKVTLYSRRIKYKGFQFLPGTRYCVALHDSVETEREKERT